MFITVGVPSAISKFDAISDLLLLIGVTLSPLLNAKFESTNSAFDISTLSSPLTGSTLDPSPAPSSSPFVTPVNLSDALSAIPPTTIEPTIPSIPPKIPPTVAPIGPPINVPARAPSFMPPANPTLLPIRLDATPDVA